MEEFYSVVRATSRIPNVIVGVLIYSELKRLPSSKESVRNLVVLSWWQEYSLIFKLPRN